MSNDPSRPAEFASGVSTGASELEPDNPTQIAAPELSEREAELTALPPSPGRQGGTP